MFLKLLNVCITNTNFIKQLMAKINIIVIFLWFIVISSQLSFRMKRNTCPSGLSLKPKIGFQSIPNGCGSSEKQVKIGQALNPFNHIFTLCCNAHDLCFGTCDTSGDTVNGFQKCNNAFRNCMKSQCNGLSTNGKHCHQWAQLYYTLVAKLGGKYYSKDQGDACSCQ